MNVGVVGAQAHRKGRETKHVNCSDFQSWGGGN